MRWDSRLFRYPTVPSYSLPNTSPIRCREERRCETLQQTPQRLSVPCRGQFPLKEACRYQVDSGDCLDPISRRPLLPNTSNRRCQRSHKYGNHQRRVYCSHKQRLMRSMNRYQSHRWSLKKRWHSPCS